MEPKDKPRPAEQDAPDARNDEVPNPPTVHRPTGSDPNDPAFKQAYPYGTYGYGPHGRIDEPADAGTAGEGGDGGEGGPNLSELIDYKRPDTSLNQAQRGELPDDAEKE